jgi:hypothetical protein
MNRTTARARFVLRFAITMMYSGAEAPGPHPSVQKTHAGDPGIARREEEECPVHLTDEQRSEAGCIVGRDVIAIVKLRT